MQRKHGGPSRTISSDGDIGNQKHYRGGTWRTLVKKSALGLVALASVLVLLQFRAGSRVGHKNAANIGVTIRSVANPDLGRKVNLGRVAGVIDERLVQEAVQQAERKPGVQLQQALQNVPTGKDPGPRPNQDSVGDLRQAAREQAAINSGVAGVGMTAAEAELVAVGREPPPPSPDAYEIAIQEAQREKDTMRVQALTEARERKIKAQNSLGRQVIARASKLIHSVVEGRKQLELDSAIGGRAVGSTSGTAVQDPVQQVAAATTRTAADFVKLGTAFGGELLKAIPIDEALRAADPLAAGSTAVPGGAGAGAAGDTGAQAAGDVEEDPLAVIKDPLDVDGPFADETARRRAAVKKAMAHSWGAT
eukprot:jgi/Botrbrau1/20364/Bobra.0006s0029.1